MMSTESADVKIYFCRRKVNFYLLRQELEILSLL